MSRIIDGFVIQKGIPIPKKRDKNMRWLFGELKVGESYVPFRTYSRANHQHANAALRGFLKKGVTSTYHIAKHEGMVRVWRLT